MSNQPLFARHGLGLRLKLLLSLVTIVAVVIGGLAYLSVWRLEQTINEAYRDKALSMVQVFDALASHTLTDRPQGVADTQAHIDDLMALNPNIYRITVYAPVGDQVLRVASSDRSLVGLPADPHDAEPIYTDKVVFTDEIKESEPMVEVLASLHGQGRPVAAVGIYLRLAPRNQVLAQQRNIALGAALAAVGLITVLVLLLTRRFVLRPLAALRSATVAVTQGQFGRTVDGLRDDEIGQLATGFNLMSLSLQDWEERNQALHHELEAKYAQAQELAVLDGLTGLYNHRHFQEELAKEIGRAQRFGHPLALLFCDLDGFKGINDTYGHLLGDRVLQGVAQVIVRSVRKIDIAARYGGDEFAIILPETDAQGAVQLAERLRSAVAERTFAGDGDIEIRVTLSIGIAVYPWDGQSREELVDKADQAMFTAKRSEGNRLFEAARLPEMERTAG